MEGIVQNFNIPSSKDSEIDAGGKLLLIPGVIDPHISFGSTDTENWNLAVQSAIRGGITTAIGIPQDDYHHNLKKHLEEKNKKIEKLLKGFGLSLNHLHYLSFSRENLDEIDHLGPQKPLIKGIVIQLEFAKKEVLDARWDHLFQLAAQEDIPIVINSRNENNEQWPVASELGETLLEKAIHFVEKWSNRLFILNVSTQKEIHLIQEARLRSLLVYAETTVQHLFSNDSAKSNYLFEAINNDVIETIGTGFDVDNEGLERVLFKGANFSFSNPAFLLPLLFTAVQHKKITLEKVIRITSLNIQDLFEITKNQDFVLVDLEKEQAIQKMYSGESHEFKLTGWPAFIIAQGNVFSQPDTGYRL